MPELPEVETTRRRLAPAMVDRRIEEVVVRRGDLRKPFPRHFAERLTGQTVIALGRRAKYLLASLSSEETLLMHLGMSGSLRVADHTRLHRGNRRDTALPHDHVVFRMSSGRSVIFNDPRRFGVMELIRPGGLERHPVVARLGPEPLSDSFDARTLARACQGRKVSLKAALLDQRVVAGLGNIYASEALHVAELSPRRKASSIATASGAPRESAYRLTAAIKQVLEEALRRLSHRAYRDAPFLVYDRQDQRCTKDSCGGTIRRLAQAGRSTFYCPVCQR